MTPPVQDTLPLPGLTTTGAVVSPCGAYRYELHRRWAPGPVCTWIMLNPSTADQSTDDPTIRRCRGFARRWGFTAITVHNLFALRSADPRALRTHPDPIGPDNDHWLLTPPAGGVTVCAWGTHGPLHDRASTLTASLTRAGIALFCLARTTTGQPHHPLYLPAHLTPRPYRPNGDTR
ncbi:MAG: DUF1643 domain-containing protein [Pseudonocardiaceae bacterium]